MTFIGRKKLFKLTKGFYKQGKNCIRVAAPRLGKALRYTYTQRRLRKRTMRKQWIISVNAASKEHNLPYSRLIYGLNHSNIQLDRKILAELGQYEPLSFKAVIDEIKLQTGLIQEQKERDLNSFEKAHKEGLFVLPGQSLPSLQEAKARGRDIPPNWRSGFEDQYKKFPKPSEEKMAQYRMLEGWESEWEDDENWEDQ